MADQPDILLVNPLYVPLDPVEQAIMQPYFPLGLMYLAAVLREHDYEVALFDGAFDDSYRRFEQLVADTRPPIVGITALITTRLNALALAEIAKRYGCTVIFGGPDPTGNPERYLRHKGESGQPVVDLIVWDEAEVTIIELMNHLTRRGDYIPHLHQIAGLRFLDAAGALISTEHRPAIEDMDSIPFPARDLLDVEAYRRAWTERHGYWSLSIINTRGCPYACTWCQKGIFGRSYRSRSAENSAREMKLVKDTYHPDQIRVVDDITGVDRKWVYEWHDAVLDLEAAIPFECLSRVNLVDVPMLTALKEMGCKKIYFGAESGSQKVLNAMKKGSKIEQIYRAAEACRQVGIEYYFFMMIGYPGEEREDIELSVKLLTETLPDEFSTTIAYPLPGTEFYDTVRDRMLHDADWQFTAENKLVFERDRYNTRYYRWVQRRFYKEWQVARARAGVDVPPLSRRMRNLGGLQVSRAMVNLLGRMPGNLIEFQPAPGR